MLQILNYIRNAPRDYLHKVDRVPHGPKFDAAKYAELKTMSEAAKLVTQAYIENCRRMVREPSEAVVKAIAL